MSDIVTTYIKADTNSITIPKGESYTSVQQALYVGKQFSVSVIAISGVSPNYTIRYEAALAMNKEVFTDWIPPKNEIIMSNEKVIIIKPFSPVLADFCRFIIENNNPDETLEITVVYSMLRG